MSKFAPDVAVQFPVLYTNAPLKVGFAPQGILPFESDTGITLMPVDVLAEYVPNVLAFIVPVALLNTTGPVNVLVLVDLEAIGKSAISFPMRAQFVPSLAMVKPWY